MDLMLAVYASLSSWILFLIVIYKYINIYDKICYTLLAT